LRLRPPVLAVFAAGLAFGSAGCGKIGPIRPPLVLIPQRIDTLEARQRGGEILLSWTNPAAFIDGRALGPIAAIEVWLETRAVAETAGPPAVFDPELFLEKARLLASVRPTDAGASRMVYRYPIADPNYSKAEYVFSLRVREARKKTLSDLSNEIRIQPQPAPMPPGDVQAEIFQDRIEIRWNPPVENFDRTSPPSVGGYNVYKLTENEPEQKLNPAILMKPAFADREFAFGTPVRYMVRAIASAAGAAILESGDSRVAEILPRDTFPPAVPAGLTAVSAPNLITLLWDPNREADLHGYKIWRRVSGTETFSTLTPEPLLENTYTDTAVEKGGRYDYAVTAVDRAGNESPRSPAVAESIKDS
jgi:hypothetical protein